VQDGAKPPQARSVVQPDVLLCKTVPLCKAADPPETTAACFRPYGHFHFPVLSDHGDNDRGEVRCGLSEISADFQTKDSIALLLALVNSASTAFANVEPSKREDHVDVILRR
jgi:hypothetical protein